MQLIPEPGIEPDEAFPGREPDGRVWNHLLKCLHFALLREPGPRWVARFWGRFHMILDGESLTGKPLADALATKQFLVSLDFLESVLDAVEPYLVECGRDPLRFAEAMGEVMLHAFEMPALLMASDLIRPGGGEGREDPVAWILKGWARSLGLMAPSVECLIEEGRSEGRRHFHLYVMHPHWDSGRSCGWDPRLFTCDYMGRLLAMAGSAAVPEVEVVATCRRPEDAAGVPEAGFDGDEFRIRGAAYGRRIPFSSALAEWGAAFPASRLGNRSVMLCERDYHCPVRGRAALARRTIYGSPCTVLRVVLSGAAPGPDWRERLIERLNASIRGSADRRAENRRLHKEFMLEGPQAYSFTYDVPNEKIYLDRTLIISGLGAKILMRILFEHIHSSRREFSNRELKSDPFIGVTMLRTNFEVRLARVLGRLKIHCPLLLVRRPRSGAFTLESEIPLRLAIDEKGTGPGRWKPAAEVGSSVDQFLLQRDNFFGNPQ